MKLWCKRNMLISGFLEQDSTLQTTLTLVPLLSQQVKIVEWYRGTSLVELYSVWGTCVNDVSYCPCFSYVISFAIKSSALFSYKIKRPRVHNKSSKNSSNYQVWKIYIGSWFFILYCSSLFCPLDHQNTQHSFQQKVSSERYNLPFSKIDVIRIYLHRKWSNSCIAERNPY